MSKLLTLPLVAHVYGTGPTKTSMRLKSGINVDVRVVPAESWGAALAYFTGSEPHNIGLRMIAQKRGWKLNEYGLFKGNKMLAGKTEKEVLRSARPSIYRTGTARDVGRNSGCRKRNLTETGSAWRYSR